MIHEYSTIEVVVENLSDIGSEVYEFISQILMIRCLDDDISISKEELIDILSENFQIYGDQFRMMILKNHLGKVLLSALFMNPQNNDLKDGEIHINELFFEDSKVLDYFLRYFESIYYKSNTISISIEILHSLDYLQAVFLKNGYSRKFVVVSKNVPISSNTKEFVDGVEKRSYQDEENVKLALARAFVNGAGGMGKKVSQDSALEMASEIITNSSIDSIILKRSGNYIGHATFRKPSSQRYLNSLQVALLDILIEDEYLGQGYSQLLQEAVASYAVKNLATCLTGTVILDEAGKKILDKMMLDGWTIEYDFWAKQGLTNCGA